MVNRTVSTAVVSEIVRVLPVQVGLSEHSSEMVAVHICVTCENIKTKYISQISYFHVAYFLR